jgi:hypothetical protein
MKIVIEYESSWRNSFLDGNNNQQIPKGGRSFIGSIQSLGNTENYIEREVTHDTVLGILCRLIGDQKKLYQSRNDDKFYFGDIENHISFIDEPNITNEVVYLRNISGNTDQNSFSGIVRTDAPIFCSDYSQKLWGVLELNLDELCDFIVDDTPVNKLGTCNPLSVVERLELLSKLKSVPAKDKVEKAVSKLQSYFPNEVYQDAKNMVKPSYLYCSSLYLQIERLKSSYDMQSAVTKNRCISGISKKGLTKKDFMEAQAKCEKKKVWGNPYIQKTIEKGEGKVVRTLRKASGTLTISLEISSERAREIVSLIENAGVSSFYLGKKGLAYVSKIR